MSQVWLPHVRNWLRSSETRALAWQRFRPSPRGRTSTPSVRENRQRYSLHAPFGHAVAGSASMDTMPAIVEAYRPGRTPRFDAIAPDSRVVQTSFLPRPRARWFNHDARMIHSCCAGSWSQCLRNSSNDVMATGNGAVPVLNPFVQGKSRPPRPRHECGSGNNGRLSTLWRVVISLAGVAGPLSKSSSYIETSGARPRCRL